MITIFPLLPSAAVPPTKVRLMRLMPTLLLVLPLSASLIVLTDSLQLGAFVLIVTKLVAEVAVHVAEARSPAW